MVVRAVAYLFLLTDSYPPFHFDGSDYPVRLFTRRTRLTRLAVLLRGFAVLPAALLAVLASVGLLILAPFAWLITLVAGRLPAACMMRLRRSSGSMLALAATRGW